MDFASMGIGTVVAITIVCYLIGLAVKASGIDNKWIPITCGGFGLLLGLVGMTVMPEFPANDYLTAAAVGVVSGLAATGVDQAIKKLIPEEK